MPDARTGDGRPETAGFFTHFREANREFVPVCWMPQSDANRAPTKLADFQQRFLTNAASSVYMDLPMAKIRKADFSPKIRLST
jgi:hypothetical protein